MPKKPPIALIFDLDGLLLDTETIGRNVFVEACREVGWQPTDMTVYQRCIGLNGPEIGEILKDGYGQDFPWEEISPIWVRIYYEFIHHQPADIKPGAVELLNYAATYEIPCGVATSSHRSTAESKLTLSKLRSYFSVLVASDDVKQGKPNPEPYLLAAAGLSVSAEQCWAFEDSEHGVRSAFGAGCTVFQVPDLIEPSREFRQFGHDVVNSLHDVLQELEQVQRDHE